MCEPVICLINLVTESVFNFDVLLQVVFDLRRGVADLDLLKIWLASIHSRAPGCPVIVIGTHKDKMIVTNKGNAS